MNEEFMFFYAVSYSCLEILLIYVHLNCDRKN